MNKKDELIDLLRERLGDLEATVDPGIWQGIQGRMAEAAVANGTDSVTELFRNGLKGAEAPVDPGVWTNISSQLGPPGRGWWEYCGMGWWRFGRSYCGRWPLVGLERKRSSAGPSG
ncbi:MAG: hypothetical protein IPG74_13680 [Flavobacteriales bacterium]|nr:hypothetical protein [Flavobacteriales bacterium]